MAPSTGRSKKRFLSTYENWADMGFWSAEVDSIRLRNAPASVRGGAIGRMLMSIPAGWQLWRASRHYDAIITDSTLATTVYGLLVRLFGGGARHLMLENLWQYPGSKLGKIAKSVQFSLAITKKTRAVVYARAERERFSECFRIPIERFVFIPYHSTLHWHSSADGGPVDPPYVFAGGESQRDYRTLFAAVKDLDVRMVVAVRNQGILSGLDIPANVEITRTDHQGFIAATQGATINVVPLEAGTLRTAGHQTYLNAMALGTVVIVTDLLGAPDYIENWQDGIFVAAGDVAALRDAMRRVLADPPLAAAMRASALKSAARYSTERVLRLYLTFAASDSFLDPRTTEFV